MANELLDKFKTLSERAENLALEKAKAQGEVNSIHKRMKEEFGCATIVEAQKMLKRLEAEESAAEDTFRKALKKFEAEFPDE